MLPNPRFRETTIDDYVKIVTKHSRIIIAILVIIPLLTAIRVFIQKPVYRATVSLMVEKSPPRITKFEDVSPSAHYGVDLAQYYQTQLKILASNTVADAVFNELNLSKDQDFQKLKNPVAKLIKEIKIEPVRNSQIVLVHVEDRDSLRASSIANAIAKAYIRLDIETRNRASKEAAGWLDSQLSEIKKKMQSSEEALNSYVQKNRIVAVPDVDEKTETLLENMKMEKSKLESELAQALKRYKEKHPKVISLRAQLEETSNKIEKETTTLLDLNQKMVQYNLLKKEAESNQQVYTSILSRAKETDVSEKIEASSIRIIDYARPSDVPFKPKRARSIIISIIFSLGLGMGSALLLEYLDATIRTAEDVRIYLGLPFLGYIPVTDKEIARDENRGLICHQNPKSLVTESFRSMRTSILFASPQDKPLKCLLITSALPQEGKSFISANISTVFSQLNERVALIDVDMRKPRIHKTFGLEQGVGLSNFLTGKAELDSALKSTSVPSLSLITSGTVPPNPSELLTSDRIRSLVESLKSKFDRVILDSPPILSIPDAALLANIVDGVMLIIKGGSTRVEAAIRAKEKILEAKGKIVGVVINNVEVEREDKYYYHYYYGTEDGKKPDHGKT